MKNIYLQVANTDENRKQTVLATVTATRGSTPQKPGSSVLFVSGSLTAGTVGGGMVEKRVQDLAALCSESGTSCMFSYSLDNEISSSNEPICGGFINVLVDASPLNHLSAFRKMEKCLSEGRSGILVTVVSPVGSNSVTIDRLWIEDERELSPPVFVSDEIIRTVKEMLPGGHSRDFRVFELLTAEGKRPSLLMLEPVHPLPRLVIAGAGHIGKALSHLGRLLDFEVTVIDDREEFANSRNLPDADHIVFDRVENAMKVIRKDSETYIVIVTRGHDDDAAALRPCIGSDAAYVGMIGSKGKIARMRSEFLSRGWVTEAWWNRLYAPVGIEIGSKTVEEIAVSIAAQLVQVRRSRQ